MQWDAHHDRRQQLGPAFTVAYRTALAISRELGDPRGVADERSLVEAREAG